MRAPSQLPLALSHPPHYGRESFVVGASNATALALIERWPDWATPVAVLSGPPGSGKTHLAHIWAERAGAAFVASEQLRKADPPPLPPPRGAMVLEDIGMEDVAERALFHVLNAAKETGASLLLTSRTPAADWRIALPDLRSRFRMAVPVALDTPEDELLRKVMVKLFADRQLIVDKAVIDYLVVRMERSLTAAAAIVEAVDREALAAGRSITRPMAARILAELGEDWPGFTDSE
jgi:chromosomal replication initiation ATPase DnaA